MEITKLFVKDLMNGKFELFCEYISNKRASDKSTKGIYNRLCKYTQIIDNNNSSLWKT